MMTKTYKVLDIFCGAGGLGYGFASDYMFDIVLASDIDINMVNTYSANQLNTKVLCKNITNLRLHDTEQHNIDIVIGGPPCQAFSTIGKRNINDSRNILFREYYRLLQETNPNIFIFENVRGLLSMNGGKVYSTIVNLFEGLGYSVDMKILNAVDYGVPQSRERVIIVGNKLDKKFIYPEATHNTSKKAPLTVKDALGDLPFIGVDDVGYKYSSEPKNDYQRLMRKNGSGSLTYHNSPKNNQKLVDIMNALPDGGTPLDIDESLRPTSGYKNTYSKLWWGKPSTTITRNLGTPSSSRCIHPKANRPLTTREGARLQSFPDEYVFCGSKGSKNLQIGNAVPPLLSIALKNSIKKVLSI